MPARQLSLFKGKRRRGVAAPRRNSPPIARSPICCGAGPCQIDIATFLIAAGHGYLCTSSFDDAVATLKDWGVLRSGIHVQ